MPEFVFKDEVYAIVGAAMEVYNELGSGFLEAVYQEALEIEFSLRGIPFQAQQQMFISHKGRRLNKTYVPDLYCYDKIVVDLKAIEALTPVDYAQMLNYLHGTGCQLGILINFGAQNNLEYKRVVLTQARAPRKANAQFVP